MRKKFDPFCGTGTTIVEAKKYALSSIGIEANPMAYLASRVKTNWNIDPDGLVSDAINICKLADENISKSSELQTLPEDKVKLLLKDSISPVPLHKTLNLFEAIRSKGNENFINIELLALRCNRTYI